MNAADALLQALRQRLLSHAPLVTLLGGAHVFDEPPHGARPPLVYFAASEHRDWSEPGRRAHEHFVTIEAETDARGRAPAQAIASEIEAALDGARFPLAGHHLVSLRMIFWTVARRKPSGGFGATLKFRAATEAFEET